MGQEIVLDLPYPPSVNNYYSYTSRGVFIKKYGRDYRKKVVSLFKDGTDAIQGDLDVHLSVFFPDKRKRDLDNILKCLLDALTHANIYGDDSQIKKLTLEHVGYQKPDGLVIATIKDLKCQIKK